MICYVARMNSNNSQQLMLAFAGAWQRLERRLDQQLSAVRGISLAEYRLLRALADAPNALASRVDLAARVGLTPSAITRALRPMEKLGIVSTVRSKRDARLAVASLTPAGRKLLEDASSVVDDNMSTILERAPLASDNLDLLQAVFAELGRL